MHGPCKELFDTKNVDYCMIHNNVVCYNKEKEFILDPHIKFWFLTCDFQQYGIVTSVDSEEPVQPHFRLRNYK